MKKIYTLFLTLLLTITAAQTLTAQERRPIDSKHPLWFIHCDVWYRADPQKIIDLIPEDIRPYVCLNLSLSCQFDAWVDDKDHSKGHGTQQYKMPDYAFQTYKTWGTVCQKNRVWFSCQPASGGHTHIQDYDLVTFEYFFKQFPNFLGWNYAEQFWGFDEAGDKSSATQAGRWQLFANLVEMSHKYGGLLTVSFCGNIWSHPLNPIGELKKNKNFLAACQKYPEAILFLYKYTTSSCFYNNESVSFGPFISGLTKNYGVRYDNCGWKGALDAIYGEGKHNKQYPSAAGIGTVMEQTCVNGGAVWDGPELTWSHECYHEVSETTVNGYKHRNWAAFDNMKSVWEDMFRQMLNGQMYIPTREEVVGNTKVVVINDVTSGNDEAKYATWGDLYDGLYKQTDPMNRGNGQWMDNFCYFKSTGRYNAIPLVTGLYDDVAKAIPVQKKKSAKWSSISAKQSDFNRQYPVVSTGDLYVNRYRNQLVTYNPHTYLNKKQTAEGVIPLKYNTAKELELKYALLSSAVIREFKDSIRFYMNNYRTDTTEFKKDSIILRGLSAKPTYRLTKHKTAQNWGSISITEKYDAATGTARYCISHCGAIDLTIFCKGNEDRSEATDIIPIAKTETPKQPEAWRGELLIEGEDMDYKSAKIVKDPFGQDWGAYRSYVGYAGNGFVEMSSSGSSLRYTLNLTKEQAGEYVIGVRYMCYDITTKRTTFGVKVNTSSYTMYLDKTTNKEWKLSTSLAKKDPETLVVTLKEGENVIYFNNVNGKKMFIDQVSFRPKDVAPMAYAVTINEADGGTVTANKSEANEGDTIRLTVTPNEGRKLKELKVINSVFYVRDMTIPAEYDENGQITFVMPHDNMTIQPKFTDDCLYKLDFSDVISGAFPEGWRAIDGETIHQYPETYGAGGGARTMVGFTGCQGKGLYWRTTGADYGRQTNYPLTLTPGDYKLTWTMAAWTGSPQYKAQILKATDDAVVATSGVFKASPSVNKSTDASVASAASCALNFTITEEGNYVIYFLENGTGMQEYLLLECAIKQTGTTGISTVTNAAMMLEGIYSPSGVRLQQLQRGLNIVVDENGKSRKVIVK